MPRRTNHGGAARKGHGRTEQVRSRIRGVDDFCRQRPHAAVLVKDKDRAGICRHVVALRSADEDGRAGDGNIGTEAVAGGRRGHGQLGHLAPHVRTVLVAAEDIGRAGVGRARGVLARGADDDQIAVDVNGGTKFLITARVAGRQGGNQVPAAAAALKDIGIAGIGSVTHDGRVVVLLGTDNNGIAINGHGRAEVVGEAGIGVVQLGLLVADDRIHRQRVDGVAVVNGNDHAGLVVEFQRHRQVATMGVPGDRRAVGQLLASRAAQRQATRRGGLRLVAGDGDDDLHRVRITLRALQQGPALLQAAAVVAVPLDDIGAAEFHAVLTERRCHGRQIGQGGAATPGHGAQAQRVVGMRLAGPDAHALTVEAGAQPLRGVVHGEGVALQADRPGGVAHGLELGGNVVPFGGAELRRWRGGLCGPDAGRG